MDPVAVVVELAEGADPALARAMIEACSASVSRGNCVVAAGRAPLPDAPHASVTWQKDDLVADIALHGSQSAPNGSQSIPFRLEDPPIERWRSVGLVVATLVGDARRATESKSPEPKPAQAVPLRRQTHEALASVRERPYERFTTDLEIMVGNGLASGPPRAGALLRASALIPKTPLFPTLDLGFAAVPSNGSGVSARWLTLGAGLGIRGGLIDRTLALEARIEGIADWVGASATDPSGTSDSGGRWQPGARAGIGAAWMFTRRIGLTAGVDGDLVRSGTVVRVHGLASSRAVPEHAQGLLGFRIGWL